MAIDSRLLDCASPSELEANFNRVLALVDEKLAAAMVGFGIAVNAVSATGALTFAGAVSDGETVTIGTDIYEFDTDAEVTEGNILVDVSGGATAADAVTALVAAIAANTGSLVSAVDGTGDVVNVTAKTKGAAGNDIDSTETCANGSWGAATLESGVDGTVADKGAILVDADYVYVATDDNTVADANWKKAALS